MNGSKQALETLSKTAEELEIQSEILSVLNDIVGDIEVAHSLEHKFNHEREVQTLMNRCRVAEHALEEYKALDKEKDKQRHVIGKLFLDDLMRLEQTIEAGVGVGDGVGHSESMNAEGGGHEDHHVHDGGESKNDSLPPSNSDGDPPLHPTSDATTNISEANVSLGHSAAVRSDPLQQQQQTDHVETKTNIIHDNTDAANDPSSEQPSPQPASPVPSPLTIPIDDPTQSQSQIQTPIRKTNPNRLTQPKTISKSKPTPMSLQHVNSNTLMSIFEYMDAFDIVALAQTNASLYTKVNTIFGLGGTVVLTPRKSMDDNDHDDGDYNDNGQFTDGHDVVAAVVIEEDDMDHKDVEQNALDHKAIMGTSNALASDWSGAGAGTNASANANASFSDVKSLDSASTSNSATIVSIPSKKPTSSSIGVTSADANANGKTRTEIPPLTATAAAATTTVVPTTVKLPPKAKETIKTDKAMQTPSSLKAKPATVQVPVTGPDTVPAITPTVVSMTPAPTSAPIPSSNIEPTTSTTLPPTTTNSTTTTAPKPVKRSTPGFQMSPAVAQSLASKLLPAELSAIIAMRDQLRKKEEELLKADEDVNDLTAQLQGTLQVKEVLTQTVQGLQTTLEKDREASAKITRQTASDQEVIAFLDDQVHELERTVDNFEMERKRAKKSMDKVKGASERQVAVLNDMLAYEREQVAVQEKEWKSTKKVLIKEVKHCRAQIMALEAERDGFREENEKLKEALLSLGAGNGLPPRNHGNGTNGNVHIMNAKKGTGSAAGSVAVSGSRSRSFDTIMS